MNTIQDILDLINDIHNTDIHIIDNEPEQSKQEIRNDIDLLNELRLLRNDIMMYDILYIEDIPEQPRGPPRGCDMIPIKDINIRPAEQSAVGDMIPIKDINIQPTTPQGAVGDMIPIKDINIQPAAQGAGCMIPIIKSNSKPINKLRPKPIPKPILKPIPIDIDDSDDDYEYDELFKFENFYNDSSRTESEFTIIHFNLDCMKVDYLPNHNEPKFNNFESIKDFLNSIDKNFKSLLIDIIYYKINFHKNINTILHTDTDDDKLTLDLLWDIHRINNQYKYDDSYKYITLETIYDMNNYQLPLLLSKIKNDYIQTKMKEIILDNNIFIDSKESDISSIPDFFNNDDDDFDYDYHNNYYINDAASTCADDDNYDDIHDIEEPDHSLLISTILYIAYCNIIDVSKLI